MMTVWHNGNNMDSKDSPTTSASPVAQYWLITVLEDRAESAPPPAPAEPESER
jgi:hypothetical protein